MCVEQRSEVRASQSAFGSVGDLLKDQVWRIAAHAEAWSSTKGDPPTATLPTVMGAGGRPDRGVPPAHGDHCRRPGERSSSNPLTSTERAPNVQRQWIVPACPVRVLP